MTRATRAMLADAAEVVHANAQRSTLAARESVYRLVQQGADPGEVERARERLARSEAYEARTLHALSQRSVEMIFEAD